MFRADPSNAVPLRSCNTGAAVRMALSYPVAALARDVRRAADRRDWLSSPECPRGPQHLRIVVFTANPRFEHTPWWELLLRTSGTSSVLLCRQLTSRRLRDVWRRQRRNVAKHGLICIPYRALPLLPAIPGNPLPPPPP